MQILQYLINGISIGSVYAIIALGYTMVYGIAKMLNFAHGDIIMVGAYISFCVTNYLGLPAVVSVIAAMVVCTLLGILIEKLAYMPLRGTPSLAVLITAIGVSYLLQSTAQMIFGSAPKMLILADMGNLEMAGLKIPMYVIVTLVASIIVMVVLTLFVKLSKTGRAMIAVSEDRGAAQLMGINVNGIITLTFAIGSGLAALAGYFMLLKSPSLTNTLGAMPGIKAFTAAVIGGIGSIPGAMVGGILLGIVEAVSFKIPVIAPYTDAIEFLILIVILLVKPSGILGKVRREKV